MQISGRVRVGLPQDRLNVEGEYGSARLTWDQLQQWQASPTVLLIDQASNVLHILPRELFESDENWSAPRGESAKPPAEDR